MMRGLQRVVVWSCVLAAIALPRARAQEPLALNVVSTSERSLRAAATKRVTPVYPPASIARDVRGVGVALLLVGIDGKTEQVRILEAPDANIAAAITTALEQWVVAPVQVVGAAHPSRRRDKITFYFTIVGGKGRVLNPDQMPGNGDVFARYGARRGVSQGSAPSTMPSVSRAAAPKEISVAQFSAAADRADAVVVDVRNRDDFSRDHRAGARNMPVDEVFVRARAELPADRPIVVDCTYGDPNWCRIGAAQLTERRFSDIAVLVP